MADSTVALGITTPGTIPYRHEFAVRIDTTGAVGAGTYSLSVDGGDFVSRGTIPAFVDVVGGARLTFTDGSPAFTAGTVYPRQGIDIVGGVEAFPGRGLVTPALTVAQLRTLQTRAEIESRLLAALTLAGKPTSSWAAPENGGLERSVLRMSADGLAQVVAPKLVRIVEMRFLDLATGADLRLYAKRRYQIDYNEATYTIQNVKLSSVLQDDFAAGDLVVKGAGGNIYRNIDPVKLPEGASAPAPTGVADLVSGDSRVDCRFQAEFPGKAYNDVAGSITQMVTAPAGVSCVNEAPGQFVGPSLLGTSTGGVTASFLRRPPGVGIPFPPVERSVRVRIEASGNVGTATFSTKTELDAAWTFHGPLPDGDFVLESTNDGGTVIAFFNDSSGTNVSFIAGDIFTFLVANVILQSGADEESDSSLRARCRGRWATLSDIPTEPLVNLWCNIASPEVDRVRVDADPTTPGNMLITIASQIGPASPAAVIAVQDYVSARLNGFRGMLAPASTTAAGLLGAGTPQERCLVASARAREVGAAGAVTVPRNKVAAIQTEADRLWALYLNGVGIGGTVYLSELYQQVMDAGAIEAVGLSIFQLRTPGVLTPGGVISADEIPVPGGRPGISSTLLNGTNPSLTASLIWKPV